MYKICTISSEASTVLMILSVGGFRMEPAIMARVERRGFWGARVVHESHSIVAPGITQLNP